MFIWLKERFFLVAERRRSLERKSFVALGSAIHARPEVVTGGAGYREGCSESCSLADMLMFFPRELNTLPCSRTGKNL